MFWIFFFFQAEDGIRDVAVTGVQTCALPISPSAPSWRRAARIPATSVLSPTSAPCSVQNVLQAPTRAHTSVFRATHRSAASLCGTVTFPAPRSEEHTSELQSRLHLVCRLLLE